MTARTAVRTVVRSGWVPAVLVVALAGFGLVHGARVELREVLLFLGYLAGWIVLPGTLAWRWVTGRRGDRPLAEDLAFGALVGYVLEFPAYLVCLAAGHPRAYLLWPLLVVAATLPTRAGRDLWRRRGVSMPLRWSWGVSALLAMVVLWFFHNVWGPVPSAGYRLKAPYIDEPFHLSLIAGLKHFFPPRVLYVDDTDLQYHWLSHLHMAAASWVTGVDPIVLLRSLALPALFLFVALAMAHAAVRLTGAGWTGLVLLGGLFVEPLNITGWGDGGAERSLAIRILISPSASFSFAAIILTLVLCVEILRRQLTGVLPWALTGLGMIAMLGAKSTSLPTFLGGLVMAALLTPVITRRFDKVAAGLAALAVAAFAVGTPLFFGGGTHGLGLNPFYFTSEAGSLPRPAAALAAFVFVGFVSTGAGLFALLTQRGYREPDALFWLFLCLSGIGAGLAFHQSGNSEYYFVYAVFAPMLLGGVVGLHRLTTRIPDGELLRTGALAAAAALAAGSALIAIDRPLQRYALTGSPYRQVFLYYVLPMLTLLAIAAAVTAAVVLWRRRSLAGPRRPGTLGVVLVLVLAGLGAAPVVHRTAGVVRDPWGAKNTLGSPLIATGGITAARWLRDHSSPHDLVATNAHCQVPGQRQCVARNFWMAGYTERQFVVEGWSYISWTTVGKEPPSDPENTISGPFWDPDRLALNDAVFTDPGRATMAALTARYPVRWLFVDLRYPVKPGALRSVATLKFRSGVYLVYRVR